MDGELAHVEARLGDARRLGARPQHVVLVWNVVRACYPWDVGEEAAHGVSTGAPGALRAHDSLGCAVHQVELAAALHDARDDRIGPQ